MPAPDESKIVIKSNPVDTEDETRPTTTTQTLTPNIQQLAPMTPEIRVTDKVTPNLCHIVLSTRFLMAILAMFGVFMQYASKLDISVNIVCMINSTEKAENDSSIPKGCVLPPQSHRASGSFNWNSAQRSTAIAGFFYGYIITEIPGGILANRFGSKITIGVSVALMMICSFLYPTAAMTHYAFFITLRIIVGLACGTILPATSNIWTSWAPSAEKSILVGVAMSGAHLAPVFVLPLGGYLCDYGFTRPTWKSLFYLIGAIEAVWLVLWLIFFYDNAEKAKCITQKEREYVMSEVGPREVQSELNAPFKSIFTSKPCWALFLCHTFANWGFYTLLTETPTYMKHVLYFDIKSNGLYSALPYIVIWLTTTVSSFAADTLLKKKIFTNRTIIRKGAVAIGTFVPAIFLIALGFVDCKRPMTAVALLAVGQGMFGVAWGAGHMCNANDLAPLHAGVVFGISNTLATLPGIITPYVTAALTRHETAANWRIVFFISAGSFILAGITFLIMGSGKAQRWDSNHEIEQHQGSIVRMQ